MGVQKCKINRFSQLLSRPDGWEISLKSDIEILYNGYNSISHPLAVPGYWKWEVNNASLFSVLKSAYGKRSA